MTRITTPNGTDITKMFHTRRRPVTKDFYEKEKLIQDLNRTLIESEIGTFGYYCFSRMEYFVDKDYNEFVLIYHNDDIEYRSYMDNVIEITAIDVTADSPEAMLRDIMRTCMEGE